MIRPLLASALALASLIAWGAWPAALAGGMPAAGEPPQIEDRGEQAARGGTRVEISRDDCQRLVRHVPAADVAYQPGQDVYGRPVAPADLAGGFQLDLPRRFSFDLEFQPLDRDELDQSTFSVGRVSVDIVSGQVTYNGRPVQSEAQAELAARCRQALQGR